MWQSSRVQAPAWRVSPRRTPIPVPITLTPCKGEIGNGRAAAILLARHGAKVALVDVNVDWAKETKRIIDKEGGISEVIQADVTSEESCKNAIDKTIELWGALHILVNIGKLDRMRNHSERHALTGENSWRRRCNG
jgi:hypothetical protein